MRKMFAIVLTILMTLGSLGAPVGSAEAALSITEYPLPSGGTPLGVARGSDGAIWFTEYWGNKIGRISTSGSITEYPLPTASSNPRAITAGPDGALWFTESGNGNNKIGRITTSGVITEFPMPSPNIIYGLTSIASGPDGALWFTAMTAGLVGKITTSGVISTYNLPPSGPVSITAGPDGAMWFGEYSGSFGAGGNKIGRLTTDFRQFNEYVIPTPNSYPIGITAGSDGAVWFVEHLGGKVGRITTSGVITEYPIPTVDAYPRGITHGPDGALWFTELYGNKIGRISTSGDISEFEMPTINSELAGIVTGSDDAVWFAEAAGKIGRISTTPPDSTPPVVTGTPDRQANANGWYNADVEINWSATDPDPSSGAPTQPAPTTASLEGDNTYTSGQSCDPAGNCATGSLALKIDKTAPSISYSVSSVANSAGWNKDDAIVTFSCLDGLSGVESCSAPVTVGEGANQVVLGTAVDSAGNVATTSVTLSVDKGKPTIAYSVSPAAPNAAGWYSGDVTVNFSCLDFLSGVAFCSAPVTLSGDGAGQSAAGTATDLAGNAESVTVSGINIDKTKPAAPSVGFNVNPVAVNNTVTLSVQVSDGTSGVSRAQYYTGTDPVNGTWTDMTLSGSTATASVSSGSVAAIYPYYVRTVDVAGNVGDPGLVNLDVYNPAGGYAAAHGFVTPNGPTSNIGDFLPNVPGNNVRATLDFTVKYASVNDTLPTGSSTFTWGSGNCKKAASECFTVDTDSFQWLIVDAGAGTATFQGLATLAQGAQSLGSNYPVRVQVYDGGLTGAPDRYLLQVYAVGSNPDFATPQYQASGDLTGGNVTLH